MLALMSKYGALMPLLGKRVDELEFEDFVSVKNVLGVNVDITDELVQAGLALMKGANINTVADMIQSPESIVQLTELLARPLVRKSISYDSDEVAVASEYPSLDWPVAETFAPQIHSHVSTGWRLPG